MLGPSSSFCARTNPTPWRECTAGMRRQRASDSLVERSGIEMHVLMARSPCNVWIKEIAGEDKEDTADGSDACDEPSQSREPAGTNTRS